MAKWTSANMPGARIWLPGSLAQWFNTWSDGQQMTGSSWSTAYNSVHQKIASRLIYSSSPKDAENVFLWLKAYGVQAAAIPGPRSPEFWKALKRSDLFDRMRRTVAGGRYKAVPGTGRIRIPRTRRSA